MSLFTNSHIVPCWREIRRGASFFHPERIISFDYGMAGTDRPVGSADFLVVVLVGIYSFTSASACKLPFHPHIHIHKHSTQLNQTNNFSSLLHNNSPPTQPNSSFTKKKPKMAPPALRMLSQRRAFSIISRVRTMARTVEPHPFERLPVAQKAAKADWGRQARHFGDAAVL
jgi:hypothetical protein